MRYGVVTGPPFIAFHVGLSFDSRTMVIYGGNQHIHYTDETCFSPSLFLYDFLCGTWTASLAGVNAADNSTLWRARSASAAVVRQGAVYVVGGYTGVVLGDVIAYPTQGQGACTARRTQDGCMGTPQCGFCASANSCMFVLYSLLLNVLSIRSQLLLRE